ncbi:MAG TPA: acyltransferase family protein [Gemmatimonadaceae bacterium]|jgi:peptidoglycan/LPS O-acetylase OafA/YrhL|nr:acyltransferase family protein [Gemmatimonadaceae bacterium]
MDRVPGEERARFRPDIEGLRAVAILFVVAYHAGWRRAAGGFLGVDVFFVLSGFLITGLLVQEVAATGSLSLTNFWARRARRLLPAATCITLVVLVANAVLLSPFEQLSFAETVRSFAVYGSNILFAVRSADYFGGAASRDPMLHTWSLSVEEQFYLLFAPALLLLAISARRGGSLIFRRRFLALTVALSVASFVGCVLFELRYPTIAFFILPARIWEFGLGALMVLAVPHIRHARAGVVEVVSLLALVGLIASAIFIREDRIPIAWAALTPGLCAAALILCGASDRQSLVARGLSTSPMRLLGRLSYSWYLWHWPVLVYLREIHADPSIRERGAAALLALVPAAITYRWIESPIRFSRSLQSRPRQVIAGAIALAALTVGAAVAATAHAKQVLGRPKYAAVIAAMAPSRVFSNGCQVSNVDEVSPSCTFGPGANDTTLVLYGDSHAAQWFPAFDSLAVLRGWKLVNLTKTGCPTVSVTVLNANLGRRYFECERWRTNSIARIVRERPTIIVMTNERRYNLLVGDGTIRSDTGAGRELWGAGLSSTLATLRPSGARLVVLQDTPHPGFDVPRCAVKHIDQPSLCSTPLKNAVNQGVAEAERAAVRRVPGVAYIDLTSILCDGDRCPAVRDGIVRYRDTNHLSVTYTAALATDLSSALTNALANPDRMPAISSAPR